MGLIGADWLETEGTRGSAFTEPISGFVDGFCSLICGLDGMGFLATLADALDEVALSDFWGSR